MYKKLSLIPIIILSTSCGTIKDIQTERSIDPALEGNVTAFEEIFHVRVDYPVVYEDLPTYRKADGTVVVRLGTCETIGRVPIRVVVNKTLVQGETAKMGVVYHELGHCSLGLPHEDSGDELDIMNTNGNGVIDYMKE